MDDRFRLMLAEKGGKFHQMCVVVDKQRDQLDELCMPTWQETKKSFEQYVAQQQDAFNAAVKQNESNNKEVLEQCNQILLDASEASEGSKASLVECQAVYKQFLDEDDRITKDYTHRCDSLQAAQHRVEGLETSLGNLASSRAQDALMSDVLEMQLRLVALEVEVSTLNSTVKTIMARNIACELVHENMDEVAPAYVSESVHAEVKVTQRTAEFMRGRPRVRARSTEHARISSSLPRTRTLSADAVPFAPAAQVREPALTPIVPGLQLFCMAPLAPPPGTWQCFDE